MTSPAPPQRRVGLDGIGAPVHGTLVRVEPFETILPEAGTDRPWVAHIPHAGLAIPLDVRAGILLDDASLRRQLVQLTDWHTDRLFGWLPAAGATAFVNRTSRLVIDPERFPDDALEPMAALGQGAVYTRTTDGRPLRSGDPMDRAHLVATFYQPYHAALTALVERVLARHGRCLLIDGHSFGSVPLPSEHDQAPDRPDVCIGTDPIHTPEALARALETAFAADGLRVKRDSPFAGALVPLTHHGRDLRVTSVMLEIRRGLYCDEATGAPLPGFAAVRDRIRAAVLAGLAAAGA
jgi:N-formylglutamate amidohydrolase